MSRLTFFFESIFLIFLFWIQIYMLLISKADKILFWTCSTYFTVMTTIMEFLSAFM